MSRFESNCAGGGYENDFERIVKGAGLEGGVISPELRVPERCLNCPTLCRLQAELSNAASRLQPWAEQIMEAQERLDEVAERFLAEEAEEAIQHLAANVLERDRQDAADKLAQLGNIAEAAQKTADDMTQVCDGPVVTIGGGRRGTVNALLCDSDVINQPGSCGPEEAYVVRE